MAKIKNKKLKTDNNSLNDNLIYNQKDAKSHHIFDDKTLNQNNLNNLDKQDNDESIINDSHSVFDSYKVKDDFNNSSSNNMKNENIKDDNHIQDDYKTIEELMQNGQYSSQIKEKEITSLDEEGLDVKVLDNGSFKQNKIFKSNKKEHIKKEKLPKQKKKKVKKSFKQRMKTLGTLIVLGVFTGSGLGVWYFNDVLRSNVNYNEYDISQYVVTADQILSEVYGINSNQNNWLSIAKSSDKYNPSFLTPAQNFILAEYNASLAEKFHAEGNGEVATIATQSVYSEKNYDGNRYSFESISKGLMSIAICSAMDKGGNTVELYRGSNIQPDDAEWSLDETNDIYTAKEYEALAGSTPDAIQPYIISDKTILSSTEVLFDETTGYYSFTFDLDPITSVLKYVRQVKQTSGLSGYPEFSSVEQTITIDENWNIISIDVKESYSVVAFGIPAKCTGTLTTYYYFNDDAGEVVLPV